MTRPSPTQQQDEVQEPARISADHVQDRIISPVAGAKKAYRRLDGLAWMEHRKDIAKYQEEAGRRLQADYEESQMQAGSKSGGERTNGSRRSWDIPDNALMADRRVNEALSVLTPEILKLTVLFLLPDHNKQTVSMEEIGNRVGEHKRAVSLGIRTALSLLARHYG